MKELRAAFDKLRKDYEKEALAQKKLPGEIERTYFRTLAYGVPEKIRATLTAEQRKTLKDLLGEPFDFTR